MVWMIAHFQTKIESSFKFWSRNSHCIVRIVEKIEKEVEEKGIQRVVVSIRELIKSLINNPSNL